MIEPLRIGMVGGGIGAFIGAVHRHAMRLDGCCELVCGALSSRPDRAIVSASELGLPPSRGYESWEDMLAREAELPKNQRMEAVAIVTPNHLHLPVAAAALNAGFHVISDKPATRTLEEARQLADAVQTSGKHYALTHTYLGYPMVREARRLVATGALGRVRKVYVEYTQDWLASRLEGDNKQASWRTDPTQSGLAGCMGDIGSHAHNLAEFVLGETMTDVRAWLQAVVDGRQLDDDGAVFFKMGEDVSGVLMASQVCAGEENYLRLRVYGDAAGLDWVQEEPNTLMVKHADGHQERLRAGSNMPLGTDVATMFRTPSGHPEGYLEAFATLYADFAKQVRGIGDPFVPGIHEALRGMAFIESVVRSSESGGEWREVTHG